MKIRCKKCNYNWEARKAKTKKKYRQCPKCYSYDLATDEQNSQKEQPSKPTIIEKPNETTIENDPEILELKKELRKAELKRELREINVPLGIEKKIEQLEHVVYSVIAVIKDVSDDYWYRILDSEDVKCDCFYCGGELQYWEEKRSEGKTTLRGYLCKNCGRKFPY